MVEDGLDYEDLDETDEDDGIVILNADSALGFAAETLDKATDMAEKMNDTQALMKIAGGWMEIHEYLSGTPHHEPRKQPLGFAPAKPPTEEEVEELDDAIGEPEGRSATRYSRSGLHPQHGEFRVTSRRRFRRG